MSYFTLFHLRSSSGKIVKRAPERETVPKVWLETGEPVITVRERRWVNAPFGRDTQFGRWYTSGILDTVEEERARELE